MFDAGAGGCIAIEVQSCGAVEQGAIRCLPLLHTHDPQPALLPHLHLMNALPAWQSWHAVCMCLDRA